ncbi:MAG TPA: hypothetical protein VFE05_09940 [Longimicrobiaceae bacterium]|jgi:hypothetical protein|nr:hypothetical protein [Longimicrobiaceae bacterium]
MRPMLDTLELPQVQEVVTTDRRVLAEHKPPAFVGSLLQNLGRRPGHVALWGVATGSGARGFVERLNTLFQAGDPVPFTADIVADMRLERVVVAGLRVEELAGKPDRYLYVLTLRELAEPVEPAGTAGLDDALSAAAAGLVDALAGALDLAPLFATGLEPFVGVLGSLLQRVQAANAAGG